MGFCSVRKGQHLVNHRVEVAALDLFSHFRLHKGSRESGLVRIVPASQSGKQQIRSLEKQLACRYLRTSIATHESIHHPASFRPERSDILGEVGSEDRVENDVSTWLHPVTEVGGLVVAGLGGAQSI